MSMILIALTVALFSHDNAEFIKDVEESVSKIVALLM